MQEHICFHYLNTCKKAELYQVLSTQVQVQVQVPKPQVRVQVQVLTPQVQVQVQVPCFHH